MQARQAYGALITVQVMYGLLPVAGKSVFLDLDPLVMTAVRVLGGATVFLLLHLARNGPWPEVGQWPGIAALALFGIVINMGLFALGLQWTHPVNATLIIMIIPVATYLFAVLLGRETVGPRRLAGVLLALLGAVYLIGLSGFESDRQTMLGDVLVFVNALSFSLYLVLSKPWAERHGARNLTTWMFIPASVVFLVIALTVDAWPQLDAAGGPTLGWMAFIIAGPTVAAYLLNNAAIRHVSSSTVAVFIYLQTPISAIAAWAILDTLPSWRILPAAALILAGVGVVARFSERAAPGRSAPQPPGPV